MECPITCVTIPRAGFQKEIHARTGRHARKKTASVRLIKLALRLPSEILSQRVMKTFHVLKKPPNHPTRKPLNQLMKEQNRKERRPKKRNLKERRLKERKEKRPKEQNRKKKRPKEQNRKEKRP